MAKRALVGLWLLLSMSWPALAQTEYYTLLMEGKKVGHAIHARTVRAGKVTTVDDMSVRMTRLGVPVTVTLSETCVETTDGKPLSFKSVQQCGAMTVKSEGTIDASGTLRVTHSSLGAEEKGTMNWPRWAVMAEGLRLLILKGGLKPGAKHVAAVFNPTTLRVIATLVTIGQKKQVDLLGRIVMLTEVTTETNPWGTRPITTTSYVDEKMRALKNQVPIVSMLAGEMIACSREVAMGPNETLELTDAMSVKSPEPIRDVDSASSITYTLSPTPDVRLTIPSTDNQKAQVLADGRIRLTVEPVAPTGGVFPYTSNNVRLLEATKPTQFIQSDREEIVALARKAVGSARDSTEAARRIEAFVAGYVKGDSLSVAYASAVEVAQSRRGDCSEFAVLTAALCRAVGIPAQVCVGVAYVDSLGGTQRFGSHAWVQAYVGVDAQGKNGKWVGLDAAFKSSGGAGYDAGHIALDVGNGDPGSFLNMATFLGKVKIEKIEVQRGR